MSQSRKSNRRRRLLVDASTPLGDAPAAPEIKPRAKTGSGIDPRLYTLAAERRHQRKTTDLIPKRRFAYSYMVLLLAAVIVLLNLLASYSTSWEIAIGQRGVQAFAIWGAGTLASWFATICWMLAAFCCMQIFVLRRHRNDDYEGTYRVWGWLTAVCVMASMVCTVDLKGIVFNLATFLTAMSFEDPAWLPMAMIGVLSSVVFVRYLLEVRQSYGTVAWGTFAWLLFNVGMLSESQGPDLAGEYWWGWLSSDLLFGNAMLFAAASVLMANTTYARFVFFRANGLVKAKPAAQAEETAEPVATSSSTRKRKTRTKKDADPSVTTETEAAEAGQTKKQKSRRSKSTKRTSVDSGDSTAEADQESTVEKAKPAKRKSNSTAKKSSNSETAKSNSVDSDLSRTSDSSKAAETVTSTQTSDSSEATKQAASKSAGQTSASEKLKQLAAASRAKQAAQEQEQVQASSTESDSAFDDEPPATVKMTKAERRRQRKQKRRNKRAA